MGKRECTEKRERKADIDDGDDACGTEMYVITRGEFPASSFSFLPSGTSILS